MTTLDAPRTGLATKGQRGLDWHTFMHGFPTFALVLTLGAAALGCATSRAPRPESPAPEIVLAGDVDSTTTPRKTRHWQRANAELKRAKELGPSADVETNLLNAGHDTPDLPAELASAGSLTEDLRRMVIMLPGRILFVPDQTELSPEGRARLDDVVAVLLASREHDITIAGSTDSESGDAREVDLSRRRADAVRNYIAAGNYQPNLVQTRGANDGGTDAGGVNAARRANERCIEIVISHDERVLNPQAEP